MTCLLAKVLQGTRNPWNIKGGGFEERDSRKMNRADQKTSKNWRVPSWASTSSILFKHSIDKAHSQYKLKSGLETQAGKPSTQMAEAPESRLTWAT